MVNRREGEVVDGQFRPGTVGLGSLGGKGWRPSPAFSQTPFLGSFCLGPVLSPLFPLLFSAMLSLGQRPSLNAWDSHTQPAEVLSSAGMHRIVRQGVLLLLRLSLPPPLCLCVSQLLIPFFGEADLSG